ncbi:hypothetical protein O6H91_05G076300 [Diphasiastrum complanatum]|nr:hypothetical protein O6H91_05G076300 [Diphasiastrum complanatum]
MEAMVLALHKILANKRLHLKFSVRRRFVLDLLAVFSGLRPLVMVDYLPQVPNLHQQLGDILCHLTQECGEVAPVLVMHIEECSYLFHEVELHDYMQWALTRNSGLKFVVLDDGPARMASSIEEVTTLAEFKKFEQILSHLCSARCKTLMGKTLEGCSLEVPFGKISPLDMGRFFQSSSIVLPTLNGWLLGYPIIYLFKECAVSQAQRCLSTEQLQHYRLYADSKLLRLVSTRSANNRLEGIQEELMSFTVPRELSGLGQTEPWAIQLLQNFVAKGHSSNGLWENIRME